MKLAICAAGELFGGVERHILDLCRYLRRRDLGDPLVLLFHDRELAARLRESGLEPLVLRGGGRYDPRLAGRVRGLLRREAVDTVHVHGYRAMITCGLARGGTRIRLVKTEHGLPELGGPGLLRRTKARLNARLDQMATRRRCDAVCYVTRDIAERYGEAHAALARYHVPNGIDPLGPEGRSRPPELERGPVHVGIVGRVSQVKAIDVAIRAFAALGPDTDARLWIVGTGPERERLESLAAGLDGGGRIRFLGFKQNVYDYLAHLDVLLMPSRHEGLPYTLLEAMSLGRALLVSEVGGLAEVVVQEETGLLVPPGDADALARALGRLVADAELRAALGEAAAATQRSAYTLEAMGAAYEDVYADRTGAGCRAARLSKYSRMREPSVSQL